VSDSLLSLIIVFAELGGVLLLILIGWIVFFILKFKREGKSTRELIKYTKIMIPEHRDQLTTYFTSELELEQNKTDFNVDTLIKDEKKIYNHLIKISITKDISLLKLTTEDINSLINDYIRLLALKNEKESDSHKESKDLILKKENEALRLEKESLEKQLANTTETIESMMGEFSSMYEGGKKEGEKRVKNEMYKLKQNLDKEEAQVKSELDELKNKEENEES